VEEVSFTENVYTLCSQIPKGRVTTYKALADAMGTKAYQAIGQALKRNPHAPQVPCHRVVKSDGSLGGYCGEASNPKKRRLLKKEGIEIWNGKISLERYKHTLILTTK
jgi:methylated-DNA-[protein]-cysteine S-methyltransferase